MRLTMFIIERRRKVSYGRRLLLVKVFIIVARKIMRLIKKGKKLMLSKETGGLVQDVHLRSGLTRFKRR